MPAPLSILDACKLASEASFARGHRDLKGWFTVRDVKEHTTLITWANGLEELGALVKAGQLCRATGEDELLSLAALYRLPEENP